MLQVHTQQRVGRTGEAVRPTRGIDVGVVELDSREVPGWPAALRTGVRRSRSRLARAAGRASLRRDLLEQPAPVERFDARAPEPAHSKRQPLQGRVGILGLLEHQHRELGEPQLARQEEPDRPGPGDDHVVELLFVRHTNGLAVQCTNVKGPDLGDRRSRVHASRVSPAISSRKPRWRLLIPKASRRCRCAGSPRRSARAR